MKRIVPLLAGLCLLVGLFATPVLAQIPPLPHAFYGTVEINDSPAPVGTEVEARGEGVVPGMGNPIVTIEAGKYGGPGGLDPKLVVKGDIEEGATLTFYVNGVAADQTAEWHSGEVTKLDLTVTIRVQPLTVTTDAATGISATAATLNGTLTDLKSASSVVVSFEWGTTTSYGSGTAAQTKTSTGSFSAALSGLTTKTTYHFRARAVGEGTSYGIDRTFTTSAVGGGGGGGGGDTTPPTISDILVSNITEISADISWKTNEMSDSQVEYGASPSQLSPLGTEMVINHLVHLTGLTPGSTYRFKVMSRDAADNLAVSDEHTFTTLGKAPAAAFAASKLSISPSEVYIGETVTISATVANTGNLAGSYTVTLKIGGVVEQTKDVTLNAGVSKDISFTTSKDKAGAYSVEVNGLKGSFTVKEKVVPAQPPPVTPPVTPEVPKPINWPVIGGIVAGVVIVGLVIFFLVRRRAY